MIPDFFGEKKHSVNVNVAITIKKLQQACIAALFDKIET